MFFFNLSVISSQNGRNPSFKIYNTFPTLPHISTSIELCPYGVVEPKISYGIAVLFIMIFWII